MSVQICGGWDLILGNWWWWRETACRYVSYRRQGRGWKWKPVKLCTNSKGNEMRRDEMTKQCRWGAMLMMKDGILNSCSFSFVCVSLVVVQNKYLLSYIFSQPQFLQIWWKQCVLRYAINIPEIVNKLF